MSGLIFNGKTGSAEFRCPATTVAKTSSPNIAQMIDLRDFKAKVFVNMMIWLVAIQIVLLA